MTVSRARGRAAAALVSACVVTAATSNHALAADVQPVIVGGTSAPGTGGATFQNSGFAAVDHQGNVTALANLTGTGVTTSNEQSVWAGRSGDLSLVAREGDQVPGLAAGVTYSSFFGPNIKNNGQLIFRAAAAGTGVTAANDGLLLHGTRAGVTVIARDGQQVPGAPVGVTYGNLNETVPAGGVNFQPVISNTGGIAFTGSLAGAGVTTSNDLGIWAGTSPATLTMLGREGDLAPGAGGATFANFARPMMNASGKIAGNVSLAGAGITTSNDRGIWTANPGGPLTPLVRGGDVIPGTGGAQYLGSFVPGINNSGNVGFAAFLQGAGVTTTNDRGLYFGTSLANLTQVAREGDAAPGLAGVSLGQINLPTFNPANQFGFPSFLAGSGVTTANDTALWLGDTSGLTLIAREGDAADGSTGGALYGSFQSTTPAMNGLGQLAFVAELTGPGVTTSNDRALYFYDPEDGLTLLARSGDAVPIDGLSRAYADLFITASTQTAGGEDGEYMGLNDLGQISILSLNGDTYLITVPEPGSFAVLGFGGLALLARRRRG